MGRRVIFRPAIGSGAVHADAGNPEGFGDSRRIMPSVRFLLVIHLRAVLRRFVTTSPVLSGWLLVCSIPDKRLETLQGMLPTLLVYIA